MRFAGCLRTCDTIAVRGIACDPDGTYAGDRLEYRPAGAAPDEPWTTFDDAFGELCTTGTLYTFDASGLPGGRYYLRLVVENACGLVAIEVDREAPDLDFERPAMSGETVCGVYEIVGSVSDTCDVSWTVSAVPDSGGPGVTLATGTGDRCGVLATWDTTAVEEGPWSIRIGAGDDCTLLAITTVDVVVDQDACAMPDLDGDGTVGFGDLLILLTAWGDVMP